MMLGGVVMRTTVTIDDVLYEQAIEVADPDVDKVNIFREAMKTFVRVQAAKLLDVLAQCFNIAYSLQNHHSYEVKL